MEGAQADAIKLYRMGLSIVHEGLSLQVHSSGLGAGYSNVAKWRDDMTTWQEHVLSRLLVNSHPSLNHSTLHIPLRVYRGLSRFLRSGAFLVFEVEGFGVWGREYLLTPSTTAHCHQQENICTCHSSCESSACPACTDRKPAGWKIRYALLACQRFSGFNHKPRSKRLSACRLLCFVYRVCRRL